MVESSKILTVSYGTFSCTLEGFEDSFGTMKAIAEYFRDLAADDRYFGAEPATPDAEMLTRIAEREVARRVEARMVDGGITLRTGAALPAATARTMPPASSSYQVAPAAPATHSDTAPRTTVREGGEVSGPAVREDQDDRPSVLAAAGPATPPTSFDADSVAAKLQRIRAVVGKSGTALVTDDDAEDVYQPQATPQVAADAPASVPPATVPDVTRPDLVADDYEDEATDDLSWDDADDEIVEDEPDMAPQHAAESEFEDAEAGSDDGAVLAGIADQMEDAASDGAAEAGDAQDEIDADDADDAHSMADDDADAEEVAAFNDSQDDVDADSTPAETDDALAGTFAALRAEDDAAPDFDDDAEATEAEPVAEAPAPVRARVIRMKRAEFDRIVAEGTFEEEAEADTVATDDGVEDGLSDHEDDLDLAALDGLVGSEDPETDAADDERSLSPEQEAALLEELAELERETPEFGPMAALDDDYDADDYDADEDETAADETAEAEDDDADTEDELDDEMADDALLRRQARAMFDDEPDADEAAMSRIMSETDAQLAEPEGSRRRQAIAQLKAAVAATEAARLLGETAPTEDEAETAFRDDLDQVVRPRRPLRPTNDGTGREQRTERPRPAPLKLVASQRIDVVQPVVSNVTPVRPRRVQVDTVDARETAEKADAGSFAEFAEAMGATELADLLEAAAAYTAFVEGVEDFSRPQIMKKVRDMSDEEFSREDGLRSFGILLRQGRISKVRNGRFQVSDQTRFHPEPRAARG
jgi:hypothetical protein